MIATRWEQLEGNAQKLAEKWAERQNNRREAEAAAEAAAWEEKRARRRDKGKEAMKPPTEGAGWIRARSRVRICMCQTAGVLIGLFTFTLVSYLIFIFGVFTPACPKTNGLVCNGYGVCRGGFCRCDPRFSGLGCGETLIPGYNELTREQCSGNGFGWPFSNFSSFCQQTISNGELVGPGWYGQECRNHTEGILRKLRSRLIGNNRFLVPEASTIPWCQCYPPWGGVECTVKHCPSDENGLVCGGNGNISVGFLTNQTSEEQIGCQCTTQVRYDIPPLLRLFTPAQQQSIKTTYYGLFSKVLCAQPALVTKEGTIQRDPTSNPSNLTVIDNDGIYGCFCEFGWGGPICTENQCPRSIQDQVICSGVGHPGYGQGLITNTTKKISKGLACTVQCEAGTSICGTKSCLQSQSPDTPLFSKSRVCTYGTQCTTANPVRCFDGSCVPIPQNSKQCSLNYEVGSIDPNFLDSLLQPCVITTNEELQLCFGTPGLAAVSYNRDGFVWNTSLPIQFNTTSPLMYFQLSTTSFSTVVSALWSEQTIVFQNFTALVSGSFRYNSTGEWISEPDDRIEISENELGYNLCNLSSFNYTGSVGIPKDYTKVRLTSPARALVFIFDVQGSSISLYPSPPGVTNGYILVSLEPTVGAQQWFYPLDDGALVTRGFCLSSPTDCSFIVWGNQVRNLASTAFLCDSGSGTPIIQATACPTPWTALRVLLSEYITSWTTCLIGTTLFTTPTLSPGDSFQLDRNYTGRDSFENEIRFLPEGELVQVSFPALLTQENIQFQCACTPTQKETNRSALDQQWWGEVDLRPVEDLVLGEWVLTSTIIAGDQRFLRSKVVGFSQLNSTFRVWNPQLALYYDSFYSNSRSISLGEVLKGASDGNIMISPYRCPDGQQSAADSMSMSVPASCNCTLASPVVDCNCYDRMQQSWTCSCQMTENYCQCESPALPEFEMRLFAQLAALSGTSCQCIIFDPQPGESTNSSLTVQGFAEFNVSLSQVPEFLIVKTTGAGCNASSPVNVTALNLRLFFNRTIAVTALEGTVQNCEHWFTLVWPDEQAISRIVVESANPILWSTLSFSLNGFSLTSLSKGTRFRASSQEDLPPSVVQLRNASFWSSNQTTLPVFIEMDIGRSVFVNYITVVFYEAGVKFGTTEIPWRIYLQGWLTAKGGWETIVSFGVYVERGGWAERSLSIENSQQFSKFRLITEYGNFAVRQWFMYTNQACLCEDGSLLTLELSSTQGLPTVQSLLDEIDAYNRELVGPGCVCTNECVLRLGENTVADFANDGVCEDAIFVANQLGITPTPQLLTSGTLEIVPGPFKLYTHEVYPGVSSIQTSNNASLFLDLANQQFFYTGQQQSNFPFYPPVSAPNNSFPNQTIYYFNTSSLVTITTQIPRGDPYVVQTYLNGTFLFLIQNFTVNYGGVVENSLACCAGCDCNDCGSSIRSEPTQTGVRCSFTPAQNRLLELMGQGNILVNQTYYVQNLTQSLSTNWTAVYEHIETNRTQAISVLVSCPGQVCALPNHYRCLNGKCVQYAEDCEVKYNCPGNGCVQQTDAASAGNLAFRCACQLGYAGVACQFGAAQAATPRLFPGRFGQVPGAQAIHCGGLPPLRMLPPIINQKRFLEPAEIVAENRRWTANSPKKSEEQRTYLRVMPSNGWGAVITFPWLIKESSFDVLSEDDQTYVSDCAPARRGYRGEQLLLLDDLEGEDPITFAPIWKVYTNPFNGKNETFTWDGVFPLNGTQRYHDFPYRCPNGQCVARPALCRQSVALFPVCNGQGECRADGYCQCRPGRKTGTVNSRISELVRYPISLINGVPDPTIWEINWNWKHFGLLSCLERDCEEEFCGVPTGCFPGTAERSFVDRWFSCVNSVNFGKCAPPGTDCEVATGMQLPTVCSSNGIPKVKDFTGEVYCHCGSPISKTASISDIAQITDLKKNGWGGIACQTYNAPAASLVWSEWDFQNDQPYKSTVTNEILPGVWLEGVSPVGPDPDQRVLWENCCSEFTRLELCDKVICEMSGEKNCIKAEECILPFVPQIFPCNNHGVARADGTCFCDSSQERGFGYTNDFTQFSIDGCYRQFQCPVSKRNNAPCYFLEACSRPEEFRYPAPVDHYLAQQPYMCGPQTGLIQNSTIITQIATSANIFLDRLIQALTQIAIEIGNALVALGGCICVYPTDTQFSKFGMLPGGNFTYLQSYHAPSLIFGSFPGYPFLTDFTEEQYGNESYLIPQNTVLEFRFNANLETNISGVRIYADQVQNGSRIDVLASGLGTVCDQIIPDGQSFPLSWLYSSVNPKVSAFYCGPLYSCATFEAQPGFNQNCGGSSTITACTNWKTAQCLADPGQYVYWPEDSPAVYEGCLRGTGGCTCCRKSISTGYPPIKDGILKLRFLSSMRVGQIHIFGVTEQALIYPPGLVERLQKTLPNSIDAASCQDYQFLSGTLGAPETYFFPFSQDPRTYDQAFFDCNNTGSYLAVPQSTGEAAELVGSSNSLMRQCNLLQGTAKKECWVGARDTKFNELYTERSEMINSDCTTCFEPDFCAKGTCPISFSTYPKAPNDQPASEANYRAPVVPGQISSLQVLNALFPTATSKKTFYTQLGDGPQTGCDFYLTFQLGFNEISLANGLRLYNYVNFRFQFIGTSGTPQKLNLIEAYLSQYGELLRPGQQLTQICPIDSYCIQVAPTSGATVPDIEYGQQFLITKQICMLFSFADTPELRNAFCDGFMDSLNMVVLQMRPTACGAISFYERSLCSNPRKDVNLPYIEPSYVYTGQTCNTKDGNAWGKPPIGANPVALPNYFENLWVSSQCGTKEKFNELRSARYGCVAFFNNDDYVQVELTMYRTQPRSSGIFGDDFIAGPQEYPFLPVFLQIQVLKTQQFFKSVDDNQGRVVLQNNVPIYFVATPGTGQKVTTTFVFSLTPECSKCYIELVGNFEWTDLIFRKNFNWQVGVGIVPPVEIYVRSEGVDFLPLKVPPFGNNIGYLQINSFVHLTTYIQSRNRTVVAERSDTYQWYLSTCLGVTQSSYITRVCSQSINLICQYDYMKYAVVNGYQCPSCGDNTRVGATPRAGVTCYDSNPLANSTAFPVQHTIYDNYLRKTLLYYASTITAPVSLSLPAGNIVWAIPECWESWAAGRSTRGPDFGGKLGPAGQLPSQNWYDMCLSCNWAVDCQKEGFSIVDPLTNSEVRTCATVASVCDLSQSVTGNSPLPVRNYPPIFAPADPQTANSNPTCGEVVLLSSYSVVDKFGVPQSDLLVNFTILGASSQFVRLQVASLPAIWYNSGKTNIPSNKFSWNYTTTVYGQYELVSCSGGCAGATMEIIIYPLSLGYAFPTRIMRVSIEVFEGGLRSYSVKFSPGPADTGVFQVNGQVFPLFPFQGVGFNLSSLPVGSDIYLYNPVLIDNLTTTQCTTRELPYLVEPLTRITSTVPFNKCIFNDEIQIEFPGQDIGTCGCSFALAGDMCDCIAVTTKYKERVCGGYGAEAALAFAYDGQFYSTGEGQNAGCYLMANGKTDCLTKDVGKCIFTLLVDGAIWNFPSVYVDAAPANGQSLFVLLEDVGGTFNESVAICRANANQLAYWHTPDELNQFVRTAQIPSFIAAIPVKDLYKWPWENDQKDTFFVNGPAPGVARGPFGPGQGDFDCVQSPSACLAMNFNNLAYNGSTCLTNGNTVESPVCAAGDIFYTTPTPNLNVYVVLFPNTGAVACLGEGSCSSPEILTSSAHFTCRCSLQAVTVGSGAREAQIFADLFRTNLYDYK